jgi:two-component system, NtrC family, response regulator HydG
MREKLKVLVVDDDAKMVRTLCDILRLQDMEVVAAYSGEEALAKAAEESPECVLMDIRMPGIDGLEALGVLRQKMPSLPVILMSAHATINDAEAARAIGAYTLLIKPIDIPLLLKFFALLQKGESVLVVDQDSASTNTLKGILERNGYQVVTESDPAKIFEQMEREYRLVVLLNIQSGAEDEQQLVRRIRSEYPAKPVVSIGLYGKALLDNSGDQNSMEPGQRLQKTFEADALVKSVAVISKNKLINLLNSKK